jgi:2-phosphosulfolactate phosphatase
MKTLEVLFTPAEFETLPHRDLGRTVGVVFDILRATSTLVTALAHGAAAVVPVATVAEARVWRKKHPELLLAGERNGLRIRAETPEETDFDLGNSPREFTPEAVRGKTIVTTTTNGTRALRACLGARTVLAGSFLNLAATARALRAAAPTAVLLVCSGTGEQAALEDVLAAGALVGLIEDDFAGGRIGDAALMARELYLQFGEDLAGAMRFSANGRRLLAMPELREDVNYCLQRDVSNLVAVMGKDGIIRSQAPA